MHKCQSCGEPPDVAPSLGALNRRHGIAQWDVSAAIESRTSLNTTHDADYLALAEIYQNRFPDDLQACQDYGFTKEFTMENR
jgi:hypothetical protein